jgi:hypothetical protein
MKFILKDIKTFGSTLCYYDFDNYDLFRLQTFLPLKM